MDDEPFALTHPIRKPLSGRAEMQADGCPDLIGYRHRDDSSFK
jgi:hypothetical protein